MTLTLLNAIKAALEATTWFKTVYLCERITEDLDLVPAGSVPPMVGITDAGEDPPQDLSGGGRLRTLHVKLAVYISATSKAKDDMAACLTLADNTEKFLHRNLLDLSGCLLAVYDGSEGTDMITARGGDLTKKTLAMRYEIRETS